MTMHSMEPWALVHESPTGETRIDAGGLTALARVVTRMEDGQPSAEGRANAERIVAAVNACAGVPTEMLVGMVALGGVVGLTAYVKELRDRHAKELAELEQQLGQLLAVAREMQEAWAYFSEYDVPIGTKDRIDAAIARAEAAA